MAYNLSPIRTIEDCEREFPKPIIISHLNTYESFDQLYYHVFNCITNCWEIPECVSYPIKFKFYIDDIRTHELSMPKFLINLNAWRPLIELNSLQYYYSQTIEVLDESFIIGRMVDDSQRRGLEAKVLRTLTDYGVSFERVSELIKMLLERYQEISMEFALLSNGSIFTLENCFLNDYIANEKIRELNNIVIPQDIQTADVEELLRQKYHELVIELGNTKNPIWYVSKAGNHIRDKQVQELFISFGQIPDAYGNVIPFTMEGNGFSTGIIKPSTYYIAATGARLSAIMNKTSMGDAGYLSRNLILLSRTLTLSPTMYDCGTKHMLKLYVKDSNFLHRLENRWYCENLDDALQLVEFSKCRHLIGKTIYIRSLVTCDGGDEVCHVCYGRDSHLVMDMPGMAIYNTEVYSEPVSQNILSTKHLLFTAANKISFNENFNKYFRFNAGDMYLADPEELEQELHVDLLSVRIEETNLIPVNQQDSIEFNAFGNKVESPIYVYNSSTKEYEEIVIENYESMFIDADSVKSFKLVEDKKDNKFYYEISFEILSSELEGRLLSIDIKNKGLTDNLHAIMRLVNREAAKFEDYNELAQTFFEILIDANIRCRHVQSEIILNRLIRDRDDIYKRPDFSKYQVPAYTILTLNRALLNLKSPTVSLSYQEIRRQLSDNFLYDGKDGISYLDTLYSDVIPTENFKELNRRIHGKSK